MEVAHQVRLGPGLNSLTHTCWCSEHSRMHLILLLCVKQNTHYLLVYVPGQSQLCAVQQPCSPQTTYHILARTIVYTAA